MVSPLNEGSYLESSNLAFALIMAHASCEDLQDLASIARLLNVFRIAYPATALQG